MQPVTLSLFWHQHQPYYPDDLAGETLMPWVRLHGSRDYLGMALHLAEVPEFRCTVNLVPSLLLQIERYVGGGSDRHLDVSRLPADGLAEADVHYLLDNFFMANVEHMIRPHARYYELYLKRGFGIDPVHKAAPRFSARDLRDLQVWSNLTWIHELVFEQDDELRELRNKGQNWTENEKARLLDKQTELLAKIIPLHRELAAAGQIELTTTPFYHPILPLLWDKRSARQAMPACALPQHLDPYHEDTREHLQRAVEYHERIFGEKPRGLWPSEGSVSQEIVPAVAEAGFEWFATDEEILAQSTGGRVSRDGHGHLRHPELLYRPWRVEEAGKSLQVVFRDHALSDLIGFHYQRSNPRQAADDLLGRVLAVGRAVQAAQHRGAGAGPALVPIILDGENCWEYYPDGGVQFLRTLYKSSVQNSKIVPETIGGHLRNHPAADRVDRLFAGSWISHNFAIWIGHHEDNTAWDRLHETRRHLLAVQKEGRASEQALQRAWEEIYIAEGSDWFWWYGDDHSSPQDALFDQLFRRHLQNVYTILGDEPPAVLSRPTTRAERRKFHTDPTGFLPVKVDGRRTYFEWVSAGRYVCGSERGTMTLVTEGLIREVHFGFDRERLLLRVDTAGPAAEELSHTDELRVQFLEPAEVEVRLTGWKARMPRAKLYRGGRAVPKTDVEVAADQIVELAVRFDDLQLAPQDPIQLWLEVRSGRQSLDRAPREGTLELTVPSPDFEQIMWQA